MRTHSRTDLQPTTEPTLPANEFEPSLTAMGTFAAGQSAHGEYHVTAEAAVGSFAHGLTMDDHPRRV
jgi:hypothetical protein